MYVGFTVLELSKLLMYEFHYNIIKKHFDGELLFTDTEILLMNLNQKMFMKKFLSTNICLTLATIQKTQIFLMRLIKKLLVK